MTVNSQAIIRATAVAVMGVMCAGAGLAQDATPSKNTISFSGYLDLGVFQDGWSDKTQVGNIARSNVAVSGNRDFGDGLSAFFKLSHRFESNTGETECCNKPFFHGEATMGFKGSFGSLKAGRALDAMYNNDWAYDPWYNFDRVASPAWDMWHYNFPSDPKANNGHADYGRLNKGIFYDSPSMGGAKLHISYSPVMETGDQNRALGVSGTYDAGPVSAMLAHETNSAGNTDTFIGLKVAVAGISYMGAHDVSKAGASTATTNTLGVQFTSGKITYSGGWGQVDVDGVKAQQTVGVGASYALDKDTNIYVDVANKTHDGSATLTGYGIGVNYSF